MEECRVGRTLRRVHALSVELLADGLAQLGLFPGLDAAAIAHGAYRAVYPHNVGAGRATAAASWVHLTAAEGYRFVFCAAILLAAAPPMSDWGNKGGTRWNKGKLE